MNAVSDRPLLLLSNDDGYTAEGLLCLRESLMTWAQVVVVAPQSEQSASSHRITLGMPLRHREVEPGLHAINGSPADCVYVALGLANLLPRKPDLVVSGINHGHNLGMDVVYSGTVAAAREGALRGCASVAVSADPEADFMAVAQHVSPLLKRMLEQESPPGQPPLLNINYPKGPPGEVRPTRLGRREYEDCVVERKDPRGRSYYWIGGPVCRHDPTDGVDTHAIDEGFVSLTPLSLEATFAHHFGIAAGVAGPASEDDE